MARGRDAPARTVSRQRRQVRSLPRDRSNISTDAGDEANASPQLARARPQCSSKRRRTGANSYSALQESSRLRGKGRGSASRSRRVPGAVSKKRSGSASKGKSRRRVGGFCGEDSLKVESEPEGAEFESWPPQFKRRRLLYKQAPHAVHAVEAAQISVLVVRRVRRKQPVSRVLACNVSQVIYLWTKHGAQHCAGRYELMPGKHANGWPLWKMCQGSYWLYSGQGGGHWCIGAQDVNNDKFACNAGFIISEKPHKGAMPNRIAKWRRWDHKKERHVADASIRITKTGWSATKVLYVYSSRNHSEVCAGKYELVPNGVANGWPIWKMRGGDYWLYSCKDGCWGICAKDVRAKGFDCCAGFILSVETHRGQMPESVGKWERWDEGHDRFLADPCIAVSATEPVGCWRLATGYCGHSLCRAAHEGDTATLVDFVIRNGGCARNEVLKPCEITENDALCEAAVEGRYAALVSLFLDGFSPYRVRNMVQPKRYSLEHAVRWTANTMPTEEVEDTTTRFLTETIDRVKWRHSMVARLRMVSRSFRTVGGTDFAGPYQDHIPLSSGSLGGAMPATTPPRIPADVTELIVDFAYARPSLRVKCPENLSSVRCALRHTLRNPSLRRWLPYMKRTSSRWHQMLRNWDYFQENTFFQTSKPAVELELELCDFGISSPSASNTRCVGLSIFDDACRQLVLNGIPWPVPRDLLPPGSIPQRLLALHAWRTNRRRRHRNFFNSLPEECFQRVLDFIVHRCRRGAVHRSRAGAVL